MKISFITLFPDYYKCFKEHSIIKKAIEKKKIILEEIDMRKFSINNEVDDYVFGGGPGMLIKVDLVFKAIQSIKTKKSYIIITSPQGKIFNQNKVKKFSKLDHLIIICGHYKGIDSRILNYVDEEISIGEFICTGGETISMLIADSIIRLIPGVIKIESHQNESFENESIECDYFTKPQKFQNQKVPKVLLSGNHKEIENWRKESSNINTLNYYKKNKKSKEKGD